MRLFAPVDELDINWRHRAFGELSVDELYEIMALRQEVFVVEQTCWYLDADGNDQAAIHVGGYVDQKLVAYTRTLPRGISYSDYASIGRVVTSPTVRGRGLGRPLMRYSLDVFFAAYGRQPVKISAQAHLQDFYGSLGFRGVGEEYLEDGIPHRAMVLD
jgi:ElaA protein